MKWGCTSEYKYFDFGGAGKPDEKYGVRDYKLKFGGTLVKFGRLEKIHMPNKFKLAKSGFNVAKQFDLVTTLLVQIGQPVPSLLLAIEVFHSWSSPLEHFHHTFLLDPGVTS